MQNTFIRRPVLSLVISIVITLLGAISLSRMPMALFPSVAPPEVNVTIEYTGANAETVTKAALVPLERAINGVPRMKYMSSDAGNDGVGVVQILFETGTDPDVAAVNVQNRVSSVMGELPEEVIRNGVKIAKEENAMLMYLSVTSETPEHDEKFLYNFTDINVLAELKRINGVGFAELLGAKRYAMRIWLKPDKMLTYRVSTDEVLEALRAFNVEAAPGKIGENSDKGGSPLQYTVKYTGKFNSEAEYGNIPLKTTESGTLRLKDVAEIEFGTTYFDVEAKLNGKPAASLLLKQLPGSNAREVITAVKERMQTLQQEAFLPGMRYDFSFDVSRFLDASVHEVVKTCFEAFLLVALVVFLFLQDFRSTLIPVIAVPVSLIGTFFFIQFLGFSLNLITLFALVLAIGIVVDDAIVVVEAVHHKMQHTGLPPLEATEQSMAEIRPAIIAITLVMASVFLPVAFVAGPAGVFYRQFALTMAIAIVLSGVVALTLTPALCAGLLRPASHEAPRGVLARVFRGFNAVYQRSENGYGGLLGVTARRGALTLALLGAFAFGVVKVAGQVPSGFIPEEDQGVFYASVTAPPGATLERTKAVMNAIQEASQGIEGVESVATLAGTNVLSDGTGATYGTSLINLKPWEQRSRSVAEVMNELSRRIAHVKDADIELFPPPSVPGYGNASGFELRLLDKTGRGDLAEMDQVVTRFIEDLKARPEIGSAFSIFDARFPQYTVSIDMDRAAHKGVKSDAALGTLQTMLGSEYATNFIRFGQMYKVMVQALPEYRSSPEQLLKLTTKNDAGELVPLSSFMNIEKSYGVDQITRYNMYPSAELNGDGKPGVSSGVAIRAVQETAKEKLPRGYSIDWAGISRDEVAAGNQGAIVALTCLVFVFLVLAAQYESFILPLSVVLSLVPGVFGSFGLLWLMDLENNIYTHIAIIVLIGLLGKNAILIVEFAELKVQSGAPPLLAVIEAARQRLRPILMTSLAFVAGLMPLVLANGAGAVGNRTIGAATAGGMAFGTLWGLVLVPGLYVLCKALSARLRRQRIENEPPPTDAQPMTSAAE
jgi:hydrophobic/amphiphilic exporter-1 (mainly G- bacteria), HAE1 family